MMRLKLIVFFNFPNDSRKTEDSILRPSDVNLKKDPEEPFVESNL